MKNYFKFVAIKPNVTRQLQVRNIVNLGCVKLFNTFDDIYYKSSYHIRVWFLCTCKSVYEFHFYMRGKHSTLGVHIYFYITKEGGGVFNFEVSCMQNNQII